METVLLIVSILLIAIVLLQSNKASDASQIISGGNNELFSNTKECFTISAFKSFNYIKFFFHCAAFYSNFKPQRNKYLSYFYKSVKPILHMFF